MSTESQRSTTPDWVQYLTSHRPVVSWALMGIGAALWLTGAVLGWYYRGDLAPELSLCGILGLSFLVIGICYFYGIVGRMANRDATRLLVLLLGGLIGLQVAIVSVWRGVLWWKTISGGLEAWQGPDWYRLWVVLAEMLVGLTILFVSLLLAREQEQETPILRRLLYGYAAALTGLLLLLILIVVNVFAYFYMPEPTDWTASKLYTLSDKAIKILEELKKEKKSVKIYFILTNRQDRGWYYEDVYGLLDNLRAASDRVQTEMVLRDSNPGRMGELQERYSIIAEPGLLVVYGDESEGADQFIKRDDLYETPTRPGSRPPFKGEDAVMSAINHLSEGKTKPVLYFTQGNGELDIGATNQFSARANQRITALVDRLQKANYEVKGLVLSDVARAAPPGLRMVVASQVPDDAVAVVVAGPQRTMSDFAAAALGKYMDKPNAKGGKKGKLLVLAGVVTNAEGKMMPLGLESLLAEYHVDLGNNRILQLDRGSPTTVLVSTNPGLGMRNPVASVLDQYVLPMVNVRTVQPLQAAQPRPGVANYLADDLLRTLNRIAWAEDNLREDPTRIVQDYLKTAEGKRNLQDKIREEPLSVGVAVSEPPEGSERTEPRPRMVVFGNADFLSDATLDMAKGQLGDLYYTLCAGSIAWLREKPSSISIPPRTYTYYQMNPDTNLVRMFLLPGILMVFCISGLGLGIWIVRRR